MADQNAEPPFIIRVQYIKDLSFENPNAPSVFTALSDKAPQVNINLDVNSTALAERTYEVILHVRANADVGGSAAFLVELDYAAVVTVGATVPEAEIEILLLRETPRFLFPFARNTLSEVTRDGGYPPLVINPIDFDEFYKSQKRGNGTGEAPQDVAASGEQPS